MPRKLLIAVELTLERERERQRRDGSKLMNARDLAAISFMALPAGKAEGGKLELEQLKHYYLSTRHQISPSLTNRLMG